MTNEATVVNAIVTEEAKALNSLLEHHGIVGIEIEIDSSLPPYESDGILYNYITYRYSKDYFTLHMPFSRCMDSRVEIIPNYDGKLDVQASIKNI